MENVSSIKLIADFFMLSVAWALVFFSPLASTELTGHGLIKLLSNTAIGALTISIIIGVSHSFNMWVGLKIAGLVALIMITTFHQDKKSLFMWILWGVVSLLLPFILLKQHVHEGAGALFVFTAGSLLGIITYSMILGHWYLVVPKLSEAPLKKAALVTWAVLLVKVIWSSVALYRNWDFFEEQTMLGAGYAFNWTLLLMRMVFGYIVIAGMSFFNWKLLNLRSIQSSTGILYAMTFFVFIGELVSTYLFYNYGLFI